MQKGIRRRQYPRVTLPGGLRGSLRAGGEVRVLNLSPGGAMLGHTNRLAVEGTCWLMLRLGGRDFPLPARVVWTHLVRGASTPADPVPLVFRSGLRSAPHSLDSALDLGPALKAPSPSTS